MNKIILFDCDGVLFDFNTPFYKYVVGRGYSVVNPSSYTLSDTFDVSEERSLELCHSFSNDPKHFGNLPWRPGAVELLTKLHRDGFIFHFITSIEEHLRPLRISAIRKVLPADAILDVTCLGLCSSKTNYLLNNYANTDLMWIDDAVSNFKSGQLAGLDSYLIDQPYNQEVDVGHRRVYNMLDLYDIAIRKYNL